VTYVLIVGIWLVLGLIVSFAWGTFCRFGADESDDAMPAGGEESAEESISTEDLRGVARGSRSRRIGDRADAAQD
jgi:hypothetical protein